MFRWIDSSGQVVKTKTVREFSDFTGMRISNAQSLACGHFQSLHGWLSPKAPKSRKERFLTRLVHRPTGHKELIGTSVTGFVKRHDLSVQRLHLLLAGKIVAYRGWMLESTYRLTQ